MWPLNLKSCALFTQSSSLFLSLWSSNWPKVTKFGVVWDSNVFLGYQTRPRKKGAADRMKGKLTREKKHPNATWFGKWLVNATLLHSNRQLRTETDRDRKDVKNWLYCRRLLMMTGRYTNIRRIRNCRSVDLIVIGWKKARRVTVRVRAGFRVRIRNMVRVRVRVSVRVATWLLSANHY